MSATIDFKINFDAISCGEYIRAYNFDLARRKIAAMEKLYGKNQVLIKELKKFYKQVKNEKANQEAAQEAAP